MCFIDTVNKYHAKALCSHAMMISAPVRHQYLKADFHRILILRLQGSLKYQAA